MSDLLVHNISEIATPLGASAASGAAQAAVERRSSQEVLVRDGRIEAVGDHAALEAVAGPLDSVPRLDAESGTLIPGFVDPHTHLPWAGSREKEFAQRLAGASYQEIAAAGGGILSTVRETRQASLDDIETLVLGRLDRMLEWGTTTAEAKSGYGLSLEDELKQLRAIERADARHVVDIVPTLLAAHETPPEYRDRRAEYVDLICREIIPAVAAEGLARYCDVFCEEGVFTADESRQVLEAGLDHGLKARLHADEFVDSGGAELAGELGALTADHLMAISDQGITALAEGGVIGGLLPGTSFFLMKEIYAPARRLIESDVPVTLATDCNPGSSHTESMPMIALLGVLELGLSIEEALTAATLNAACSIEMGDEIGTVERGKQADLVILDVPNLDHLAYHFGINPVATVIKRGGVVHRRATPQRSADSTAD